MAKPISVTSKLRIVIYLFLLSLSLRCANSARILIEDEATIDTPISEETPIAPAVAPVASSVVTAPVGGVASTASPAAEAALTFFMHDTVGGSSPSVANSGVNTQLPFSKLNGGVLPVSGGAPLLNGNNGISTNNMPLVTGIGPITSIQNNGNRLPYVTSGQIPAGSSLEKLMFGSITVIDDKLTESHELGSSVIGNVQGFYLASSQDGSSQTMAFTALLHGTDKEHDHDYDSISFFGIHKTATPLSHIAVIGGTGKYESSKGYATVESLHEFDQHSTDGVETVLKISVYVTP